MSDGSPWLCSWDQSDALGEGWQPSMPSRFTKTPSRKQAAVHEKRHLRLRLERQLQRWATMTVVAASVGQGALAEEDRLWCKGTPNMRAADWDTLASYAEQGPEALASAAIDSSAPAWDDWHQTWLPYGNRVSYHLEKSMADCPEATIAAIANALPAMEATAGDEQTIEMIKFLNLLLGDGRRLHAITAGASAAAQKSTGNADGCTPWQRNWLVPTTALVRFMYQKWVNVKQDNDHADGIPADESALAKQLRPHHEFLFRHSVDDFVSSGIYDLEMTENSVLFSEAFAFAAFCKLHNVEFILESGVYKGVSTEIWSLIAAEVVAVDISLTFEAETRLSSRKNVKLMEGDGRQLIPPILKEQPNRPTAIFVDGPKGELAIRLAAFLLDEHPQVAFIAIHDMGPYKRELARKFGAFFFSDEPWFQAAYGHLDAPFKARPDIEAGGTMAFLPQQKPLKRSGSVTA